MNVVFVTGDPDLDKKFVAEAKAANLHNLNGHRSIGGMRASIYNAMPEEGGGCSHRIHEEVPGGK